MSDDDSVKLEHAWKTHAYLNNYIQFADAKAGVVITLASGVIIFTLQADFLEVRPIAQWLVYVGVLAFAVTFIAGILVVTPRLFTNRNCRNPCRAFLESIGRLPRERSLIFWGGISAYRDVKRYEMAVRRADSKGFLDQVLTHNFTLSTILDHKYFWLTVALRAFVVGIGAIALFVCLNGLKL